MVEANKAGKLEFASLAEKLSPADGWAFRKRTLVINLDGTVKVVMDDLRSVCR